MLSKTQQFIEKALLNAEYEFDDEIKEWAVWIKGFPGIYAQRKTIEETRNELAEIFEEYLIVSLRERRKIKGFDFNLERSNKVFSHA